MPSGAHLPNASPKPPSRNTFRTWFHQHSKPLVILSLTTILLLKATFASLAVHYLHLTLGHSNWRMSFPLLSLYPLILGPMYFTYRLRFHPKRLINLNTLLLQVFLSLAAMAANALSTVLPPPPDPGSHFFARLFVPFQGLLVLTGVEMVVVGWWSVGGMRRWLWWERGSLRGCMRFLRKGNSGVLLCGEQVVLWGLEGWGCGYEM